MVACLVGVPHHNGLAEEDDGHTRAAEDAHRQVHFRGDCHKVLVRWTHDSRIPPRLVHSF